ncbi:MAG: S8 family peptidase [Anaerolineales bacterium]
MKKTFALFLAFALMGLTLLPTAGQGQRNGNGNSRRDAVSEPGELLVQFKGGANDADKNKALAKIKGEELEKVKDKKDRNDGRGDLVLVKHQPDVTQQEAVAILQADPAVEFAEPNWIYTHQATSNDPYYTNGSLWGMYGPTTSPANQYGSNAATAWAAGEVGDNSVYVGVIDEGIQFDHPDLNGQVWTNPFDPVDGIDNNGNGYVDDIHGWDFAGNNSSIYDGGKNGNADDHGTHVSGTIGARGGNGAGVAGGNWNVTIISAKFLGRIGGTTANAIKAVDYMTDLKTRHGLNIVATNNSWGGGGFSQALSDAIERASGAGILFIAAAGNAAVDNDASPHYPSSYDNANIIAVASITSTGALSSFSNWGASSVDIGAPGSSIQSTLPKRVKGKLTSAYGAYSGTSMATPHVTGAAALYASTHAGASHLQIRDAILSSGTPTASLAGKTVTGDRLNAGGF